MNKILIEYVRDERNNPIGVIVDSLRVVIESLLDLLINDGITNNIELLLLQHDIGRSSGEIIDFSIISLDRLDKNFIVY